MTQETLGALVALALAMVWTPGPNNALVAASGAHFGLRRSMPHVLGIALGFALMIFVVGFFLGSLFQSSALLREGLRLLGAAILLWLAWKVARSGGISSATGEPRPFTFLEACAFQWINPKAWAMAIAISSQFILADAPFASAATVGAVFVLAGLTSASGWAWAGQAIARFLTTPGRLRLFNLSMAGLIVASVALLLIG